MRDDGGRIENRESWRIMETYVMQQGCNQEALIINYKYKGWTNS